jgi:acyl-CoA synthetase (AMP-forming)/AMP-acid ligase II
MNNLLDLAGVAPNANVGWIARNHPAVAAGALGLLISGRSIAPLNPLQPPARLAEQAADLRMSAIVGLQRDWTDALIQAVAAGGTVGVLLDIEATEGADFVPGLDTLGAGPFRTLDEGVVLERISSGTTGEPKRVPVQADVLQTSMEMAKRSEKADGEPGPRLHKSPTMLSGPFGHSSGIFYLVMCLHHGRPFILFEKFDPLAWAEAVDRFGVKVCSLVPSMISMVLEADPPAEQLSSLICVRSGTAPLDPVVKASFEERYGIPILTEYGASEFVGGVAGWTLADHREFATAKRGAAGRLRHDVEARVMDAATGAEMPPGQTGVLWLKSDRWSPDWIATTDLAALDEDGFLYIRGRADEAIIRGGFKILPEQVAEALRRHASVRDASVLGIRDARLGQAPLAVVEPLPGKSPPTLEELQAIVREHLPSYNAPVAAEIVAELPRTPSLKVARPAVRAMFADKYDFVV